MDNGQMNGLIYRRIYGRPDMWVYGRIYGWMCRQTDMDGCMYMGIWTDIWLDIKTENGRIYIYI